VIALVPVALMLSLPALGLQPSVLISRSLACYELPANIRAPLELRGLVAALLARSATLRTQCEKIAAAPKTYVTVELSVGPFSAQTRARSTARRYPSGLLLVDVEIPPASQEFAELLGHELEHVTEFIEGVDFKALSRSPEGGVVQCGIVGSFESIRAQHAGRAVSAEIDLADRTAGAIDPRVLHSAPALPVTRWR